VVGMGRVAVERMEPAWNREAEVACS
jgi:hypothetical protein